MLNIDFRYLSRFRNSYAGRNAHANGSSPWMGLLSISSIIGAGSRWMCAFVLAAACAEAAAAGIVPDVTVSYDQNSPSGTVTSPSFSTNSANELLLAFVATDAISSSNTTVRSVSGGGLTWVLVARTNAQPGTSEIWRAFAPAILHGVTVSATLSQTVVSTIVVSTYSGVAQTGTNGSGAIGAIGTSHAQNGSPSASLVTTQNNSLVVGIGNDYDYAIPRTLLAGQTLIHQDLSSTQDTYWVQRMSAPTPVKGTRVTLGDSAPTADEYNLSICEILPAPSVPTLRVSTSTLSFGSVTDGSSKSLSLILSSTGSSAVTVTSDSITGTGFSIKSGTLPATLSPGQTLTLTVAFSPTTAAADTGQLTIKSNSSAGSSNLIALTGTGVLSTDPQLTLSTSSLNFGTVTDGSSNTLSLILSSTGTSTVTVSSVGITGTGFSITSGALAATLTPGQTLAIQIKFAPTTAVADTGQLTIQSNSTTGGTAKVSLAGTGTLPPAPKMTLSTSTLAFGTVTDGSSETLAITLTSSGTESLSVNSAAVTGTGFSMTSGTWPQALAPGKSLTLQVKFAPTTASAATGQLTIGSNSSTGSTSTVALSGTGAVAPKPVLTVSTTSLNFGTVTVGTSSTELLTLKSAGTSAVTVNTPTITGTGFSIIGGAFPISLNPGATTTLTIQFLPSLDGAVSGQLTVNSNSSAGSAVPVALTGTGTAAATYSVNLTWEAPVSTADPIAGYHIYRAVAGSTTFILLNSAIDTQTNYADTNVANGTTYDYEVKSVDDSGVESAASNEFTATIP